MNIKDDIRNRQFVLPGRPKVGDRGLSVGWTDMVSDGLERLSNFGLDQAIGLQLFWCKLTAGSLKPSGMAQTPSSSPALQTRLVDVFGLKLDGSFVDTGQDLLLTNRTMGYFYQNSFVKVMQDPQSGEWHIIHPSGHKIFGQFDTTCTRGATQTFSVYYSSSSGVWTDTADNIATTDPAPVYNEAGASASTITSGKRCVAELDPRGLIFAAGPLECN